MGNLSKRLSRYEFACKCGCGFDTVDVELPIALEDVADHFYDGITNVVRVVIHINSGNRCLEHNKSVGAKDDSQHVFGRACDFWLEAVFPAGNREKIHDDKIADYLERQYKGQWGIGRYSNRTHLDTRTYGPARWDAS